MPHAEQVVATQAYHRGAWELSLQPLDNFCGFEGKNSNFMPFRSHFERV